MTNPFPDPSTLDPIDVDQHAEIIHALKMKKIETGVNGLVEPHSTPLNLLVATFVGIFQTYLSKGPLGN